MNIEFHYYVTHMICTLAGLAADEARTIAYSSQYVDHNIISYAVDTGKGVYRTAPTQNYGFWDDWFPREVYIPFHFFPGDPEYVRSRRGDARVNPFCCTPDSPRVKELLIEALKTRNPYRIGIALHTYADSWAHQNWSGLLEDWNVYGDSSVIPAIGHAQALTRPDSVPLTWQDPRLAPEHRTIRNLDRVLQAARRIYKYLCVYNRRPFDDADAAVAAVERLIGPAAGERTAEERIADIVIAGDIEMYDRGEWPAEALERFDNPGDERLFRGYDKVLWLRDAVLYRSSILKRRPARARAGFIDTHFHRWHEAAREHLACARRILSDLLRQPAPPG